MPTYLMLTNLTAEGLRTLKNNPGRVTEVNKEVEQMGGQVVTQYATLGDYDFVTVIEAPDEQTMAKISVELGSRGTMTCVSSTAGSTNRCRSAMSAAPFTLNSTTPIRRCSPPAFGPTPTTRASSPARSTSPPNSVVVR